MLTPEQLEERRSGIGGSDAAIVLNIHPFRDPLWLYHDKRGTLPVEEREEKESLFWGSLLEQPICDYYSAHTGHKVIRQPALIRSKTHPFMIANVDRRVVGLGDGRRMGFEAKSDAWGIGWGPSRSDEIPPYIMIQIQHYLAVTGWDEWDLGVLIGNRDFRQYKVFPIESIIKKLIDAEEEFWDRIRHGVPPEANYEHRATKDLIKTLYPGTNGTVLRLPPVASKYAEVMEDAKAQKKIYEQVIAGCQNRLAMLMGEASAGLLEDGTCLIRKEVSRSSYTVDATKYISLSRTDKLPKLVTDAIEKNAVIESAAPALVIEHNTIIESQEQGNGEA